MEQTSGVVVGAIVGCRGSVSGALDEPLAETEICLFSAQLFATRAIQQRHFGFLLLL